MNTLVIGDTHAPFTHPHALDFLAGLRRAYRPRVVVHIGDLGDQHGWSQHERHPDGPGQADEDKAMLAWCRQLYRLFPRVLVCIGNHDRRLARRAVTAGLPSRLIRTLPELYESPRGWVWAEGHVVDGVVYQHGDGFRAQDAAVRAAVANRRSTVCGHIHTAAGVRWIAGAYDRIFGAATGCLIDPGSLAFEYAARSAARPVLGSLIVSDGVPQFIPMER